MTNEEKGVTGSGKPSPIKLLRRPLLEQGIARTLNAIEGIIDAELESGRQLLLSNLDEGDLRESDPARNNMQANAIVEEVESQRQPKQDKNKDKKKGATSISLGTRTDEFVHNLKVALTSDQLETLESFCVKIRGEIMRKQKRRKQIRLQTLAQFFFIKVIADEKFRKEFQSDIVQNCQ